MEIISYLDLFLGAFLNVIYCILVIRKIFNIKILKNKSQKLLIVGVIALGIAIVNVINKNVFKAVFAIPLLAISVHILFDIKVSKSIYYTIVSSLYLLMGDLIISLILSIIKIDYTFLEINILGKSIGNIMVILSVFPLTYINWLSDIFKKLENIKINKKTILKLFISFLIIGSAFVFKSTTNIENLISIVMNFILFLVFIVLLYFSYLESRKLNKISDEYNSLFKYLDKYEKELIEKRKLVHDFKNQLIIIKGYIDDKEKLNEYLNGIIEEHKNIRESKIIKNIDKLPSGLKGLIYYKLSQIEEEIKISLTVNSRFKIFDKLSAKDNRNVLKVVGILIDNAIESSIQTNEKYIIIDIYIDKRIFKLHIINSCKTNFEKFKIMELGFSTKGKHRGYGLSLVKDIIRNDDRYSLVLNSNEEEFISKLIIKLK